MSYFSQKHIKSLSITRIYSQFSQINNINK